MADPIPSAQNRRIALLIDADNVSHGKLGAMLAELSKYGTAHIRRAYGDWASPALKGWTQKLHEHAVRPIQQFSYSAGKNATDMALVIDAMDLLHTQRPDAFCIASSDADFTPLVMQLRAYGLDVYGFGERKALMPFVNACSTFLYLDQLPDDEAAPPAASITRVAQPAAPPLSSNTKLINILRGAVAASVGDNGWAHLGTAGSAVKRAAPIDPRNHGCRNFPKLFEATGLFEIAQTGGVAYIADKRNKDRAKAPGAAR